MKVGITGTQHGWTEAQRTVFTLLVAELGITEWHHGDCVGVDEQASQVVKGLFGRDVIHCHPPLDPRRRAYVVGNTLHKAKPFLERNDDIAYAVELLIVIPRTIKERIRSGTWHTCRCARKYNKDIIIIGPSGERL